MGSAVVALSRTDFLNYPVPSHTQDRQKIVEILDTLEEKIECNAKISQTLEAIVRTLFKAWFVDFQPVQFKLDGRWRQGASLPGLPCQLYNGVPDSLVSSAIGEVPNDWPVVPFSETIDIISGGTPKTSVPEYWGGDIPWFSVVDAPKDFEVWVTDTEKKITSAGLQNSAAKLLPIGTTIISARGTVGKTAMVAVPMAINQSCYAFTGKKDREGVFTYFATRELVGQLQKSAHGSVFDTITRTTLSNVYISLPPPNLIEYFESSTSAMMNRIKASVFECQTLRKLRDSLLPKLITGEICAKHAERLAESVL